MSTRCKYKSIEEIDDLILSLRKRKEVLAAKRILNAVETGKSLSHRRMGPKEAALAKEINALNAARRSRLNTIKKQEQVVEKSRQVLSKV
jgi:hypothetical protein